MKNESTRGTLIIAVILGVATAVYLLLFFLPGSRAIAAMMTELNEKQTFILEAQKARKICEQLERELEASGRYNAQFATQLIKRHELPALYSQVSKLAKTHEVATPKIEPRPEVEYESFHKVTVGLGVEGSFAAIHRLLADLEALPQCVWVTEMKLHAPRQVGRSVECEMTLVVFIDNLENND